MMAKGYQSVVRFKEKAFSQGENFHVGMTRLEAELTWKEGNQPVFIPFIDDQGHQGIRIIIEKGSHRKRSSTVKKVKKTVVENYDALDSFFNL